MLSPLQAPPPNQNSCRTRRRLNVQIQAPVGRSEDRPTAILSSLPGAPGSDFEPGSWGSLLFSSLLFSENLKLTTDYQKLPTRARPAFLFSSPLFSSLLRRLNTYN